jgi:hypothetical protein
MRRGRRAPEKAAGSGKTAILQEHAAELPTHVITPLAILITLPFRQMRGGNLAPGRLVDLVSAVADSVTEPCMIRKLKSGQYRLYSQKKNPKTGKRRNLGTFSTRAQAERHERAVQYFKRGGGH